MFRNLEAICAVLIFDFVSCLVVSVRGRQAGGLVLLVLFRGGLRWFDTSVESVCMHVLLFLPQG